MCELVCIWVCVVVVFWLGPAAVAGSMRSTASGMVLAEKTSKPENSDDVRCLVNEFRKEPKLHDVTCLYHGLFQSRAHERFSAWGYRYVSIIIQSWRLQIYGCLQVELYFCVALTTAGGILIACGPNRQASIGQEAGYSQRCAMQPEGAMPTHPSSEVL